MTAALATMPSMTRKNSRPPGSGKLPTGDRHKKHKIIRISPELWERLARLGKSADRNATQEGRRAIRLYVEEHERRSDESST